MALENFTNQLKKRAELGLARTLAGAKIATHFHLPLLLSLTHLSLLLTHLSLRSLFSYTLTSTAHQQPLGCQTWPVMCHGFPTVCLLDLTSVTLK